MMKNDNFFNVLFLTVLKQFRRDGLGLDQVEREGRELGLHFVDYFALRTHLHHKVYSSKLEHMIRQFVERMICNNGAVVSETDEGVLVEFDGSSDLFSGEMAISFIRGILSRVTEVAFEGEVVVKVVSSSSILLFY